MSKKAMELALEALSFAATPMAKDRQKVLRAQSALREALAEQKGNQEPVAWMDVEGERVVTAKQKAVMQKSTQKSFPNALSYIQPPEPFTLSHAQRKPLTEEEMYRAIRPLFKHSQIAVNDKLARMCLELSKDEYRAIEAAHGIKDEK